MKYGILILLALITTNCGYTHRVTHRDGKPGENCSVEQVSNGAIITCIDSTAVVLNGENGIDAVVEIIDPCGNKPGHFDEVILRLNTGDLLAYFEENGKRFLSILTPGNYQTTDSQKCSFTVDNNYNVLD